MTLHAHIALKNWQELEAERIKVHRLPKCTEDRWNVLHVLHGVHNRDMEVLLQTVGKERKEQPRRDMEVLLQTVGNERKEQPRPSRPSPPRGRR